MLVEPDITVSIDRGGTFCDVIASIAGRDDLVFKLLSEDPQNYRDALTEAIRRVLEVAENRSIPKSEKLNGSRIGTCRIGSTIATNALLEGKGEKFALLVTKGFRDICTIGDQTRPDLFALNVRKATPLHDTVFEIDERVTIEDYDLDPFPKDKSRSLDYDPELIRTASGEIIRLLKPLDTDEVRQVLLQLKSDGYTSVAISFLHSFIFPEHEDAAAAVAREVGFEYVTTSAEDNPVIKYLLRANSACSEAYLCPVVKRYIANFESGFEILPNRVDFMCSDGGLRSATKFKGNEALLSGPAGGVVGIARSCFDAEEGTPIIGFDMGGTSTDVSRYDGTYDYLAEATIAGRIITTPMLNIATVAAGGGSILSSRNGLLLVGPESAGAHPGPACYRKGGPLTVTDANLFLGRLVVSEFPAMFGKNANETLDYEITVRKFGDLTAEINAQTGENMSPEQVALGFLNVANEAMSRPIRNATEARGFAPELHNLVSFGGAGGQHACAIADILGIKRILIHRNSSVLSAYGISKAELQFQTLEPFTGSFTMDTLPTINHRIEALKEKVRTELSSQGASPESIRFDESLSLRFKGTDTKLSISRPLDGDFGAAFRATHLREFAFVLDRPVIVESINVRGTGSVGVPSAQISPFKTLDKVKSSDLSVTESQSSQRAFVRGSWQDVKIYNLMSAVKPSVVIGPALIIDITQTILVEPGFIAYLLDDHIVVDKTNDYNGPISEGASDTTSVNPIQLSIFSHRFMSIAEQMGHTLQRTSISTSIKERLDFSCAIFSSDGKLVANAPHIPIHLGSMQYAIQYIHKNWLGKLKVGDVLLTNHPECGGTHLPDLTVITPVFINQNIAFYVASRGHHTDIGGKGITSMMPSSKQLWEEGLNVRSMKIVEGGRFLEDEVREAFLLAGTFPGCSPTRRLADNISDLKAQTSANQRGILLLQKLCDEFGLQIVLKHMLAIQSTAEIAVRNFLLSIKKQHPDGLTAIDHFDDGTKLQVKITIDEKGGAIYDFSGTGPQMWGNYNCPVSITYSAVIYTIRCLIGIDIPLNDGCLAPIDIRIPKGSVLRPNASVAICGSTLASQRVIDTILRAYGRCAAFAGCANSFGWGQGGKDPVTGQIEPGWNYGESLGGGCGAGPTWHGEHATQVHSTNTKITDPEVVEKRTPVLVRTHAINYGSGGRGQFNGGSGGTREIMAREPLKFSILSDRRVLAPYGMHGGEPGSVGKNYAFKWNEDGSELERVHLGGKAELSLEPGEYIQINTPGGGGWGLVEE